MVKTEYEIGDETLESYPDGRSIHSQKLSTGDIELLKEVILSIHE
jgi:hypothetical protein